MTQNFIKEHFRIGANYATLVMTQDRLALQAWLADTETKDMQRMDAYIADILNGGAVAVQPSDFKAFCEANQIDTTIPDRSIALTFRLRANAVLARVERMGSAPHAGIAAKSALLHPALA